jgi:hypothetical protein
MNLADNSRIRSSQSSLPQLQNRTDVVLHRLERKLVIGLVEDIVEESVGPFAQLRGRHCWSI